MTNPFKLFTCKITVLTIIGFSIDIKTPTTSTTSWFIIFSPFLDNTSFWFFWLFFELFGFSLRRLLMRIFLIKIFFKVFKIFNITFFLNGFNFVLNSIIISVFLILGPFSWRSSGKRNKIKSISPIMFLYTPKFCQIPKSIWSKISMMFNFCCNTF